MADNQRNAIFAEFLYEHFPHAQSILNVACGDSRLSVILQKKYPMATVVGIDPNPRGNKKRTKSLRGLFPQRVNVTDYDLIVGMHPDEATWPIVELCCKHMINFSVVPCCLLHTPKGFRGNMHSWAEHISNYSARHHMRPLHTLLEMKGANHVIVGRKSS